MARGRRERVVVVTGASAGLGRAIATAFARPGCGVALLARGRKGLDATAEEVDAHGADPLAIPTDVADWSQVRRAAERVEEELGPVDVWVNNAMTSLFGPFTQTSMKEFRRATEVDYLGFVHGTKAALDHMLPRDRGVVVQVGSALAFRSIPLQSAYCGSKHAIVGFTETLRTELRHDRSNVHVTMVQMPAMNTPQFDWVRSRLPRRARPVAPIFQPEIGARAVRFAAAHPARRNYEVGMSTVLTVWANKFVPGLLDRYLARTGYQSQQGESPEDPDRPDNLFEPVEGDRGAHGRFDAESHHRAPQVRWTLHRRVWGSVIAGAAVVGAAGAGAVFAPVPLARSAIGGAQALSRTAQALSRTAQALSRTAQALSRTAQALSR